MVDAECGHSGATCRRLVEEEGGEGGGWRGEGVGGCRPRSQMPPKAGSCRWDRAIYTKGERREEGGQEEWRAGAITNKIMGACIRMLSSPHPSLA